MSVWWSGLNKQFENLIQNSNVGIMNDLPKHSHGRKLGAIDYFSRLVGVAL